LCVIENEEFKEVKMTIQRVYCKYCKITHSVLPIEAMPYCYYSIMCIMAVLNKYYLQTDTIYEITEKYNITQIFVYTIVGKLKAFSKFIADFLRIYAGADVNFDTTPRTLLKLLLSKFNSYSIIKPFFEHSRKIFLMTRSQNILSKKLYIGVYD
jgi:hypothetical protein